MQLCVCMRVCVVCVCIHSWVVYVCEYMHSCVMCACVHVFVCVKERNQPCTQDYELSLEDLSTSVANFNMASNVP